MALKTVHSDTLAGAVAAINSAGDGASIDDIIETKSGQWVILYTDGGAVTFYVATGDTVTNMVTAANAAAPDDYALSFAEIFRINKQYAIVFNDEGATASTVSAHEAADMAALITAIDAATPLAVVETDGGFAAISIAND